MKHFIEALRKHFQSELTPLTQDQYNPIMICFEKAITATILNDHQMGIIWKKRIVNEQRKEPNPTVEAFWRAEFFDQDGTPCKEAMGKAQQMPISTLYQWFCTWFQQTYGEPTSLSQKLFGGQYGCFLRVAGEYFEYRRTYDGRRIFLRPNFIHLGQTNDLPVTSYKA